MDSGTGWQGVDDKYAGPDESAEFWNDMIGPFFTVNGVLEVLNLSEIALSDLVGADAVLELTTTGGERVYPAFQFSGGHRTPVPRLPQLLATIEGWPDDPWNVALVLNRKIGVWGNRSVIQLLRSSGDRHTPPSAGSLDWGAKEEEWLHERHMAVARAILDRFVAITAALPVHVDPDTLFVSRDYEPPTGVFLVSLGEGRERLSVVNFALAGDTEQVVQAVVGYARGEIERHM